MNIYPTSEQEEEDIRIIYKNCLGYEDNRDIMNEIMRDEEGLREIELESAQLRLSEKNISKIPKKGFKKAVNKNNKRT